MLGSDNASCLASHDAIPYIYCLNKRLANIKIKNWVYTEACTGENRLDSHFSFMNLTLSGYLMDGNDILNEDDIYAALCYLCGIRGSTGILFDGENLKDPVLKNKKEFKVSKTGVRETHEVTYTGDTPHVYTILGVTEQEIVTKRKIDNYEANKLNTSILHSHQSNKPPLFIPQKPEDCDDDTDDGRR